MWAGHDTGVITLWKLGDFNHHFDPTKPLEERTDECLNHQAAATEAVKVLEDSRRIEDGHR